MNDTQVQDMTLSHWDVRERYDDMLDECYGTVMIGGHEYATSYALEAADPTAYEEGMRDYADSLISDGYTIEGY